jgi:retron-type reverse transcriptase
MDARPERGCHTALREIYYHWVGTAWFLEGDISQCFDKLNHELLLQTLSENIHDGRFINLMRELLDAGYMEEWTYSQTLSGVPQGGIVSPILSNILLNKLDQFVETKLIPRYTKGVTRGVKAIYFRRIRPQKCQRQNWTSSTPRHTKRKMSVLYAERENNTPNRTDKGKRLCHRLHLSVSLQGYYQLLSLSLQPAHSQ